MHIELALKSYIGLVYILQLHKQLCNSISRPLKLLVDGVLGSSPATVYLQLALWPTGSPPNFLGGHQRERIGSILLRWLQWR